MNIAVLASGSGTNLQEIINATENGTLPNVRILQVIADRNCHALKRARKHKISAKKISRKNNSKELESALFPTVDYIVLAGYLSILSAEFCNKWDKKIINLHPSLLPKYGGKGMYGKYVHQAVLDNQEKETGATVHFVTSGIDEGEIILQKSTPLHTNETVESIAKKVQQIEYTLLIEALQLLAMQK